MPLSGEALNEQGNAITRGTKPSNLTEWVTIGSTEKTVEPEETTAPARKIKKTGHGLNTGDIIVFTELNGKTTFGEAVGGLVIGVPYYVRKVSTSEFALAYTKAQAESATEGEWIEWTVTIKTTSKLAKLLEHTGAKTKRIKTGFAVAANLTNEDATAREIEASGTVTIKWVLFFSAETSGTFMGCEAVTEQPMIEGNIYKITTGKVSQNAYVI